MRMKQLFCHSDVFAYPKVVADSNRLSPRLKCTLKSEADEAVIYVTDVIGDEWAELNSAAVVPVIHGIDTPIRLFIDTPGGSVFDAVAIYQTLVAHPHMVTADVIGMSASAGTIITSAADHIRIAQAGTFMLHRAWTVVAGNSAEMQAMATTLEKFDRELDTLLSQRSGLTVGEVSEMMVGKDGSDGTWLTGKEAVEKGFADELLPTKSKPAEPVESAKAEHASAIRGMALDLARMRSTRP